MWNGRKGKGEVISWTFTNHFSSKTDYIMDYTIKVDAKPTTKMHLMEFFYLHKYTVMMYTGVLLSIPAFLTLPNVVGAVGVVVTLVGTWRQLVEISNSKAEERRKQELHAAKIRVFEAQMAAGEVEKAGEVVG